MLKSANGTYPLFKSALLTLLSVNVVVYAALDTLSSTLDALAWVILLIMFELETAGNRRLGLSERTLHRVRNVLITLIVAIFFTYVRDQEWLDVVNSILWFALIAVLELEIRRPDLAIRSKRMFVGGAIGLFTALVCMIPLWVWQKAWLDAYDAALWIVAFAAIDVDILHFLQIRKNTGTNRSHSC